MKEQLVKFLAKDLRKLKQYDVLRVHFPDKNYGGWNNCTFSKTTVTKINQHTFHVNPVGDHKQDDILIVNGIKDYVIAKSKYRDFFVIENTLAPKSLQSFSSSCLELIDSDMLIYVYPLNGLRYFHNCYNKVELYKQIEE